MKESIDLIEGKLKKLTSEQEWDVDRYNEVQLEQTELAFRIENRKKLIIGLSRELDIIKDIKGVK